ncbi:MAG: hypothetical protein M3N26_07635 [Pseudomonadota bacterium]|nr:hypothetical protein [Pseudomonadota bacterium]
MPTSAAVIRPADQPVRHIWTYASVTAARTLVATGETRLVAVEHAPDQLLLP